jgi:hypothetical protein
MVSLGDSLKPCYDRAMRAFVCEVDPSGLRRFIPDDLIPWDDLRRLARSLPRPSTSMVWTLLDEDDADDLRADLGAGRHAEACGLLLNRAVELVGLGSVVPFMFSVPV